MDIVKQKIKQLDGILRKEGRITNRQASEITQIGLNKISRTGRNRAALVALVEEMRPVYENWSCVEDIVKRLRVSKSTVYQWYKNEGTRKAIGAVKVQERIRFSPKWFDSIDSDRKYIDTNEAVKILHVLSSTVLNWRHRLQAVQPFGKRGKMRYDESKVIELKKEIDKTKGLLRPSEAATDLGIDVQVLKRNIPFKERHPITKERYYDLKTLDKFRDSPATELSSLKQVLDYCDEHYPADNLREVVKHFVEGGRLRTVHDKRMKSLFLEHDEEMRIRRMYENISKLGFNNLLWPREAAKKIGISSDHLTLLIKYGRQTLLDEETDDLQLEVNYKGTSTRLSWVPVLPYFKFFLGGIGYVHFSTANEMRTYVRGVDISKWNWIMEVAKKIRKRKNEVPSNQKNDAHHGLKAVV